MIALSLGQSKEKMYTVLWVATPPNSYVEVLVPSTSECECI